MEPKPVSNLSAALASIKLANKGEGAAGEQPSQLDTARQEPLDPVGRYLQNGPHTGITLFSHRSAPNGYKVAVVLSELGIPYHTFFLDMNKNEHRSPSYVQLNPNGRIPSIVDHDNDDFALWESGSIILYLCQRQGPRCSIWSDLLEEQAQIYSWLFFQASGPAPMIGQALHFRYFHAEAVESAIGRYTAEVRRLYGVVEMRLAEKREQLIIDMDENTFILGTTPLSESKYFDEPVWLVGSRITIADLSFVTWNSVVQRIGINLVQDFPEVYKWTRHMMRRPAVARALSGLEEA